MARRYLCRSCLWFILLVALLATSNIAVGKQPNLGQPNYDLPKPSASKIGLPWPTRAMPTGLSSQRMCGWSHPRAEV